MRGRSKGFIRTELKFDSSYFFSRKVSGWKGVDKFSYGNKAAQWAKDEAKKRDFLQSEANRIRGKKRRMIKESLARIAAKNSPPPVTQENLELHKAESENGLLGVVGL